MAAGHIVNGQCVDVAASVDFFFSNQKTLSHSDANYLYQTFYTKIAGTWKFTERSYSKADATYTLEQVIATTPSFPSCDTSDTFNDGLTLGWAVVAAMVAAYAIHLIRRAL